MDTRGLRHLKAYLGPDGAKLAKAKRAVDVVPVLAARQQSATTTTNTTAAAPLSPSVMHYLESRLSTGATHKLSRTQMSLVQALAAQRLSTTESQLNTTVPVQVTRGKVGKLTEMVDTVALSALELTARATQIESSSATTPAAAAVAAVATEMSTLFVLTDSAALVHDIAQQLEERYGLTVLQLADSTAPRHPTFPSSATAVSKPSKAAAKSKKAKAAAADDEEKEKASVATSATAAAAVVVVVASPAGFLAVDRRSAIWKFIGAMAVLLCHDDSEDSLLSVLKKGGTADVTPLSLNAQRWACLGHVSNIAILAQQPSWLSSPLLELLTTASVDTTAEATSKTNAAGLSPAVLASSRRPVTVHYTVAAGTHRFQFLFSLLKGLVQHRGIVVHVATRECAMFLYDALYAFVEELPPYVQVLSDYEGASAYTSMHTAADRQRLCSAFDTVVETGKAGKTAAVLISCYGLVPRKGSVFLQYDIIPDLANYTQFIAEVLTPGAVTEKTEGAEDSIEGGVAVRREKTTRQRKRSVSPPPSSSSSSTKTTTAKKGAATAVGESAEKTSTAVTACANYTHILLLFRPNEVEGALAHLRSDGAAAARYKIDFRELPNKAGGRYLFIGERLKSMNKKLFAIQNAAYHAYKATMRVYSTISPRDVYDETKVALDKVAEEFGYTELPLLDLRLKDTAFRPKEDYFRAARQKQETERRAYKKFAKENILGEEPEEHVADLVE